VIFSSLQYLLFLPVVVVAYWRTRAGARLWLLVVASYIFYMSWLPVYGVLLALLTAINYAIARLLAHARGRSRLACRALFLSGLTVNLGCLCYYKYTGFILENLLHVSQATQRLLSACGLPGPAGLTPAWQSPALTVLLPLGISFFVFEFVHYLTDVYRGDKPIRCLPEFAAFAAFFPSQIAGPIKRYQDFIVKLRSPQPLSIGIFNEASTLIIAGLFKKVAIADPIGSIVQVGFASSGTLATADALIISVGFVIQVYCDFSGYTDMGRGSALLLGIRLPENFALPYLAKDLADFWRRWHITLGSWLRDYLYVPLGGSRQGRFLTWRNLFVTMVACGLWHGAAWHYVIFGAMHGFGLIVNREWQRLLDSSSLLTRLLAGPLGHAAGVLITMIFVTVSFVIFRAPDMTQAANLLSGLYSFTAGSQLWLSVLKTGLLQILAVYITFWLATELMVRKPFLPAALWRQGSGFTAPLRAASWTAALLLILAARPAGPVPFVYFQF